MRITGEDLKGCNKFNDNNESERLLVELILDLLPLIIRIKINPNTLHSISSIDMGPDLWSYNLLVKVFRAAFLLLQDILFAHVARNPKPIAKFH